MSNDIAKALKQKTDAMLRLQGQSQKPVVYENVDGNHYAPEPSDYTAALAQGKNIKIITSGNIKTISAVMNLLEGSNITISEPDENGAVIVSGTIAGKDIRIEDFTGKDGYLLSYSETLDIFELIDMHSSNGDALLVKSPFGNKVENFENFDINNLSPPSPVFTSINNVGWTLSNTDSMDGGQCHLTNPNSQPASDYIEFTFDALFDGNVSFYYKMSVSANGDSWNVAYVKLDGAIKFTTRNNATVWTKVEFPCTKGNHVLRFDKSSTIYTVGWKIDNLTLPTGSVEGMEAVNVNPNTLLAVSQSGEFIEFISKNSYLKNLSGAALPAASADYRGQIFTLLGGTGVADIAYICIKNASEGYEWRTI